ncbi:CaiB/BaiF CoA-transferase family protein [Sporomusa sp.]|uniref:CaiB/BaiF CoA transferase family protein n=1 Tax=Sporomusa sp. TaxID=2078658 RepID=UPI002CA27962|nr:CaiB/BaiF CoA-transferase family protein [Sporomusa sp.]HWR06970.1 CaiB/BaiF CoA-transferase family protein [Sporomusa sp.]
MDNQKPLSGYRIVELATFVAAPVCARLLGDWGADVIKVESPAGDAWRTFGQTMSMPVNEDENPAWEIANTNKRAIAVDLKNPHGQKVLHDLLQTADVFITNNRIEALKKINLDYESLKEKYPRLIYGIVTGFGENGPDVNQPGFDSVAFWGRSGFLADLVPPGAYPVYSPAGFGDLAVGTILCGGISTALLKREKTGKGEKVSISLFGASVWLAGLMITSTQSRYQNKYPKERLEGNPMVIPYKTKDGEWVFLTVIEYDRYWPALCKVIEREDLITDARFKTRLDMLNNRAALIPILEEAFETKDIAEWLTRLREADIVHVRLQHLREIENDQQAWANDYLYENTFANGAKAILPSSPIQWAEAGALPRQSGPLLGEHTQELLEELGYTQEQIEELKNQRAARIR